MCIRIMCLFLRVSIYNGELDTKHNREEVIRTPDLTKATAMLT